jgi:AMP nucleosidase
MPVALERAAGEGADRFELKWVVRVGMVISADNQNWELGDHVATIRRMSQSRAIAVDMESATVAANGFCFRVPYGTLLCVSDKPLHGEIEWAGIVGNLHRVGQHLEIGLQALEELK